MKPDRVDEILWELENGWKEIEEAKQSLKELMLEAIKAEYFSDDEGIRKARQAIDKLFGGDTDEKD